LGYVLAVSCDHRIPAFPGGKRRLRADQAAAALPVRCWQRISAGTGSKGPRWYDWAWVCAYQPGHSLLIRRGSDGTLAFYRCWSPAPVPLAALVRVAGMRWSVEVRHLWCPSSGVGLSLWGSFSRGDGFGVLGPAGSGVVAGRAGAALA
jgi:SRSO17 transposase